MSDERQARMDAIRARLEAATPGPWEWVGDYPNGACPHQNEWTDHGPDLMSGEDAVLSSSGYDASHLDVSDDNAELIANAPADLAYLLSELDAAQARAERAEALNNRLDAVVFTYWLALMAISAADDGDGHDTHEDCPGAVANEALKTARKLTSAALAAADGEGQG